MRTDSTRRRSGTALRLFRLVPIVAALCTIGCDRVTKHMATTLLDGRPEQSFLSDTIRVGYAENPGAFLSLGAGLSDGVRTTLFVVVTGVALLTLAALGFRRGAHQRTVLGVTLFLAGGASNWFDRVSNGSVVDFLNIGIGPVRTGIFNIADVAIMAGAVLCVAGELWPPVRRRASCSLSSAPRRRAP